MKTHYFVLVALLAGVTALSGCNQDTSGGPGATNPPTVDRMGQSDNTFSMTVPNVALNQGETATIAIEISRGDNFNEDVSLSFAVLPTGVAVVSEDPIIKRGDKELEVAFKVSEDAALGDFTIEVTGQPTKGAAAKSEMTLSIGESDTMDAAKAKWEEYTLAMDRQWDQFKSQYADLQERAAKAEGQAKEDLDRKLAEAKVKMDEAAVELDELKEASADRWEKVKEGVTNAFDDLKTIFE